MKKLLNKLFEQTILNLAKSTSLKVESDLCPLFFVGKRIDLNATKETVKNIENIFDYCAERDIILSKNIRSIIFFEPEYHTPTWTRKGDITIAYGESTSENFLYLLGMLIWRYYCLEIYKAHNLNKGHNAINHQAFRNIFIFFEQIDINTHEIESFFKEIYPFYVSEN